MGNSYGKDAFETHVSRQPEFEENGVSQRARGLLSFLQSTTKRKNGESKKFISPSKLFDAYKNVFRVPESVEFSTTKEEVEHRNVVGEWVLRKDFDWTTAETEKILLHFHGGAFTYGSPANFRFFTGALVEQSGLPLFSVDYPIAPDHSIEEAVEFSVYVYDWLIARKGYSPSNIFIVGECSGASIALLTLLSLRDSLLLRNKKKLVTKHIPKSVEELTGTAIAGGCVLISPWTDLSCSSNSYVDKRDVDPFAASKLFLDRTCITAASGGERDLDNPMFSPYFANLAGLPPLYILVGENEVVYEEAKQLSRKAMDSEVPTIFQEGRGLFYCWPYWSGIIQEADETISDIVQFFSELKP